MHSGALLRALTRPGSHVAQARSRTALGSCVTWLPGSHTVNLVHRPPRIEKRPAAQASQPVAANDTSKPTEQPPHDAWPAELHRPLGHGSHAELPLVLLNVPATHAPQEAAPVALKPPAAGWKRPAAQSAQGTAASQVRPPPPLEFDAHGAVAARFATRPGAQSKQRRAEAAEADDAADGVAEE